MSANYVDPFTDFGFKKIFGEEASKPMLMDFLNALLPLQTPIINLSFRNPEQLGRSREDRRAVYDIYCENEQGEKFIVEMQKEKQDFFMERSIYYSGPWTYSPLAESPSLDEILCQRGKFKTTPWHNIVEQGKRGEWDFNLKPVFCIGILDFTFHDYETDAERQEVVHVIRLKDQQGRTFYEKLTYIYLEMPNFHKKEHELVSRLDKWLYFIKNLEDFEAIPGIFQGEDIFEQALERASLAKMNFSGWLNYQSSLKGYRDLNNVVNTAAREAAREGLQKGLQVCTRGKFGTNPEGAKQKPLLRTEGALL